MFLVCSSVTTLNAAEKGLVGHWSFDKIKNSVVKDLSGKNDGHVHGQLKVVEGISGNALYFDGKTYLDCGNDASMDISKELTIEVWIKPDLLMPGNYYTVVSKTSPKNYPDWILYYPGWTDQFSFIVSTDAGKPVRVGIPPGMVMGKWRHVVAVYNGKASKLYVDGVLKKSVPVSGKLLISHQNLIIGQFSANKQGGNFIGAVDELKIYNRALDKEEIASHYQKQNPYKNNQAVKVIDYPSSLYVPNTPKKAKPDSDWIRNARVVSWKIPKNITPGDAEKMAKECYDLGINTIMPEGYRYLFGSKDSPLNWWHGMDFKVYLNTLKTFTEACHKRNIKVVGHLTARLGQYAYFKEHPDQAAVDLRTGKPAKFKRYSGYGLCSNNPDFLKTYLKRLDRVMKETHADGMMIDEVAIIPPTGTLCGCKYCRKLFKEQYGYEIPDPKDKSVWKNWDSPRWRAWQEFRIQSVGEFRKKLKQVIDKHGPNMLFTGCYYNPLLAVNAYRSGGDPENYWQTVNIAFYECEPLSMWSWRNAVAEGKYLLAFGPTLFHSYSKSLSQQFFAWAFTLSNGFRTFLWPSVTGCKTIPLLWEKKWEDLFLGQKNFCNVAVVFSSPTRNLIGKYVWSMGEYVGWTEALTEEHVPFDVVIASQLTAEKLRKYQRVILPDTACLSNNEMDVLKDYVNAGGTLIATDESSLYDETGAKRNDFGLKDVFGVSFRENISNGKIAFTSGKFSTKDTINYKGVLRKIQAIDNVSVIAKLEESDSPAIVMNEYGSGKSIYLNFRPGTKYFMPKVGNGWIGAGGYWFDNRNPDYKELMLRLVKNKITLPITTKNIPQEIIVNPFIHDYNGYKGISIHLLNCLGTRFEHYALVPSDPAYEFLDYPSPKQFIGENATMTIRLKAETVKQAYLISPDFFEVVKLKFSTSGNGFYDIEIPDLGRYEIIYLVTGKKDIVKDLGSVLVDKFPKVQPFRTESYLFREGFESYKNRPRIPAPVWGGGGTTDMYARNENFVAHGGTRLFAFARERSLHKGASGKIWTNISFRPSDEKGVYTYTAWAYIGSKTPLEESTQVGSYLSFGTVDDKNTCASNVGFRSLRYNTKKQIYYYDGSDKPTRVSASWKPDTWMKVVSTIDEIRKKWSFQIIGADGKLILSRKGLRFCPGFDGIITRINIGSGATGGDDGYNNRVDDITITHY